MTFAQFVNSLITNVAGPVGGLIFALATFYFIWNVAEVIRKSSQPEELAKLKDKVLWGVIALAVMLSLWGLVRILTGTLNWGGNTTPTVIKVIGLPK